jgi:two-component system phosphate regulon sensor histidine kinase PhoR
MTPRMLFWVPALLRLAVIPLAAGLVWWWFGAVAGAIMFGLMSIAAVLLQLFNLYRLSNWLDDRHVRLPDGGGAWTNVFARLYHFRREEERNRQELSEWLARFRQAMRLLPDGVVIMDDVLFLEWCNPEAERHLGLSLERDKGMRVTNLVRTPEFIDYIVLGRYEQPLAMRFRDRKLILQIIPFETRRQILVTHDVTVAEQMETMRRDFVANASHELRTPLTVINGFLEIAADPDIDTTTRAAHVRLMAEQGRRMQNLVDDMLVLTRLESPDYPIRSEPLDMHALTNTVATEAKALSAGRHQITVECSGPDVMGSADELRSAFGNLVSNAIRYTPDGGQIDIAWRDSEAGPLFMVRDNGIGIEAQHLSRLTERFYRVDKNRSRETRGTGLGLAIVKHVMLRHGATLGIDSVPGKGSVFSVRFPVAAVVAAPGESSKASNPE